MSAPASGMEAAERSAAEGLLDAFKSIDPADKARHEAVLEYWLSIRGNRELPPLRDLDPLEISDAARCSALLELVGGGEDAEIRHLGEELKGAGENERIAGAPRGSVLSCIARKLSIVAISRNFLAFEDEVTAGDETARCFVTLLPLSSAGAWVDYVYAFVTLAAPAAAAGTSAVEPEDVGATEAVETPEEPESVPAEDVLELDSPHESVENEVQPVEILEESAARESAEAPAPAIEAAPAETVAPSSKEGPGFSLDGSSVSGFYGTQAVKVRPTMPEIPAAPARTALPPEPPAEAHPAAVSEMDAVAAASEEASIPAAEEQPRKPSTASEGTLQSKLTEVRAKADEARQAKLKANAALYEGLSAAYDFALDAEDSPEEYLRLVEGQGLKIQLRSPMRPVVKLAFEGLCDDSMIAQLEAVLAWAIDQDLPRGSLAQRIEEAGGIGPVLNGEARAA